jgi:lysophospholipid acyltransferase (LPLAT)-like uncharacterized protein
VTRLLFITSILRTILYEYGLDYEAQGRAYSEGGGVILRFWHSGVQLASHVITCSSVELVEAVWAGRIRLYIRTEPL